jgi:hypothetical protein
MTKHQQVTAAYDSKEDIDLNGARQLTMVLSDTRQAVEEISRFLVLAREVGQKTP